MKRLIPIRPPRQENSGVDNNFRTLLHRQREKDRKDDRLKDIAVILLALLAIAFYWRMFQAS